MKSLAFPRTALAFAAIFAATSAFAATPEPDWSLQDVNSNSIRYQDLVSPTDYRMQVSAYYFGHSD